jgi:hypothetical protein
LFVEIDSESARSIGKIDFSYYLTVTNSKTPSFSYKAAIKKKTDVEGRCIAEIIIFYY